MLGGRLDIIEVSEVEAEAEAQAEREREREVEEGTGGGKFCGWRGIGMGGRWILVGYGIMDYSIMGLWRLWRLD